MRNRSLLVVLLCLASFALGAMLNRPATGQAAAPAAHPTVGRFALRVAPTNDALPYVVVLDTATGRCWSRVADGRGDWQTLGLPPGAEG